MLTGNTEPTEDGDLTRSQMLRYMDRFRNWSRKLDDEDLGIVVAFCANVQRAYVAGKATPPAAAEAVQQGLPGLGGDDAPN